MRSQTAGRVVRVRKLARNAGQQILREDQIESTEYEALQANDKVVTGVEQSEESEYHLQAALAASSGTDKDAVHEIPAPRTQESDEVDYESLYSSKCPKPATYIRFSQTVEECTGCQYDMTAEDDVYLKDFNQKKTGSKLSENDFEKIMYAFEETAAEQAPFASIDNTVVPLETMRDNIQLSVSNKVQSFAKDIYDYWKLRRQDSGNKPLQPSLKFEKNQELDDGDPYVCFRRRDVRQARKTRNRDILSAERLKKLRREIEEGRSIIAATVQREMVKRDHLLTDKKIYKTRETLKNIKVKAGIKTDDDDLINVRPQKRKISDYPSLQRPPGSQLRLPGRTDGRPLDADLVQLSDLIAEKENLQREEMEEKSRQHRKWNQEYVDLTGGPLSPEDGHTSFRPATAQYQYLMTPPSSVTSDAFDQPSPSQEKSELAIFRYSSPPPEDEPRGQPAYRRRIGRGGRLWIDRRGMLPSSKDAESGDSDRWKYDQDGGDEQPVYEVDPHDTKALRFRASIPFPAHLYPQRLANGGRATATSPSSNRAIAATVQTPQQPQAST